MPHTFRLHREARERGVAVAGSVSTLSARLSARAPVSIAVLGSSVAEQGGCNRQAGKECQRFDGVEYAKPGWGRPPKRPFKGWAVRLLDWLNESWPHEQHTLYNGAQSATPLHTALPCLFSFLPPQSDLVIIEPMSMGELLQLDGAERILRTILSPIMWGREPPTVALLNVPLWTEEDVPFERGSNSTAACKYNIDVRAQWSSKSDFGKKAHSPKHLENQLTLLCLRYNVTCLSLRRALRPEMRAQRAGFAIEDVAADCLHPMHGRWGTEYVTDILVDWIATSVNERAASNKVEQGQQIRYSSLDRRTHRSTRLNIESSFTRQNMTLPLQLLPNSVFSRPDIAPIGADAEAACFLLHTLGFEGYPRGRPIEAVPWRTAHCPHLRVQSHRAGKRGLSVDFKAFLSSSASRGPVGRKSALMHSSGHMTRPSAIQAKRLRMEELARGCSDVDLEHACSRSVNDWGNTLPKVWLFCLFAQSVKNPKRSPSVNAYVPGATIFLPLQPSRALAVNNSMIRISLKHLVSYEGMGVAIVRCFLGCSCAQELIDAAWDGRHSEHRSHNWMRRNVSAHLVYSFLARVEDSEKECIVALTVAQKTSSLAHRFVLKDVAIQLA